MKSGVKWRNLGSLWRLEVTQGHRQCQSTLIETMRLSCTVFEIYPAICRNRGF